MATLLSVIYILSRPKNYTNCRMGYCTQTSCGEDLICSTCKIKTGQLHQPFNYHSHFLVCEKCYSHVSQAGEEAYGLQNINKQVREYRIAKEKELEAKDDELSLATDMEKLSV